ncbi:hypothetical protein C8A03DRAFT_41228 [Achaetomium macrosporum]|uniref:Uncharacterized protein n=1 Tax=Achaetomium macrosporum TaxID=79813 RepID=A0AAN7CGK9_9PEZI|nr:hypothetical protein C8A03DRAFT_41228 [Achaetomium macrosporum]
MGLHLLYGAVLFGVSVQALAFEGPRPTDPFQAFPQNAWSPKPTPGPDVHALLRRQNTLPSGYLLAPDNTCGFINANSSTTTSTSKKTTTTSTKSSTTSTTNSSTTSSTSSEASSSSTEASTAEASITEAPSATSSVSTTSGTAVAGAATASTTPVASDAPSTPVGAIVGGVVGGIALIALHKKKNDAAAAAAVQPPGSFMSEPTIPPVAPYAQPPASPRGSAYNSSTPHQSSASAPSAHIPYSHNNHNSASGHSSGAYPGPSSLSTPSGSPRPQYQHQPHAPSPVAPPAYLQQHNHSPNQSGSWTGVEPPDRRSTSTPVSTYNGTTPVTPASALGPMPGEQATGGGGGGMPGVPLILQPGMGYRPYRPPSAAVAARPATAGSGSGNRDRSDSVSGNVSELPAKPVTRSLQSSAEGAAVAGNQQSEGKDTTAEQP